MHAVKCAQFVLMAHLTLCIKYLMCNFWSWKSHRKSMLRKEWTPCIIIVLYYYSHGQML